LPRAADPAGTLLLFWDYDTQWGGDRSRLPGGKKDWGGLEFTNTERLLELHARFEVPACFAVVGAAALPGERPYHDPEQIRRIHAAGHEVGSHSFHHEWIPGLSRQQVRETLRASRDALEQCIGAPVDTFVPPYNQPFDHPARLSVSLSERRNGGPERMNLAQLCRMLGETGYRFCRVAYRPGWARLIEAVAKTHIHQPARLERIAGLWAARLNTPCGFAAEARRMLDVCARRGGLAVVYGHPHSITSDGPQNERELVPFLERARELARSGRLRLALPRDLLPAAS
jgi:peptidoglycan/xylan/chitin deacetylase (PgdA/CDA1 family)